MLLDSVFAKEDFLLDIVIHFLRFQAVNYLKG